jgi:hypothetical protein
MDEVCPTGYRQPMDDPSGASAPLSDGGGADGGASDDADLVVVVLHRVGRCSLQSLRSQPELLEWTSGRLEQAVVRAWNGGLVFIDRNDDLVAL